MRSRLFGCALVLATVAFVGDAAAQPVSPIPDRSVPWQTVTGFTMAAAGATQLLMPRVFYSDPEVTVGWKARFHVSVLAPVMTLTALTVLNESAMKNALQGPRPGCDGSNQGLAHCDSYGMVSSHSFAAFSALGHGAGIFLFDTTKWSGGRFNPWSFIGNVVAPFGLAVTTGLGRGLGNWEDTGQILLGGVTGLGIGFLSGMTYSLMQRPECGYTGSLICW
jgi:hypothetical protein